MQPDTVIGTTALTALPDRFQTLAWRTFFADRGRGVSLAAHFPWLFGGEVKGFAVTADHGGTAAAMLVVREGRLEIASADVPVAAIGLVCTDPAFRARGLASRLIETAIAQVEGRATLALLWTGRPDFYRRVGFEIADPCVTGVARIGKYRAVAPARQRDLAATPLAHSTRFGGPRGLPTFVRSVEVFESAADPNGNVTAVAIGDPETGPILLDWRGDPNHALGLIGSVVGDTIGWNGSVDDPLHRVATRAGWEFALRPTNLAMWRPLAPDAPATAALAVTAIPLLDRF